MTVREQHALPVCFDHHLIGRAGDGACDEIVIAVDVSVLRVLEAARDFRMVALGERELRRCVARQVPRERFPDVTEQDDAFEVVLEERQEPKELAIVVPEPVSGPAGAEMQIRYDCDFHG